MKKVTLVVVLCLMMGSVASAGVVRDNCGIGFGTSALDDVENPTLLVFVGATFLNAICGNQTFAITTGTLDAKPYDKVVENNAIEEFIADNMDSLAMEIAAGNGETLNALADLYNVEAGERDAFCAKLQSRFSEIYNSEDIVATQVFSNIDNVVQS